MMTDDALASLQPIALDEPETTTAAATVGRALGNITLETETKVSVEANNDGEAQLRWRCACIKSARILCGRCWSRSTIEHSWEGDRRASAW
jgi:hypothetical protein